MNRVIDVSKNSVLMKWRREAHTEGRMEGRVEGLSLGRMEGLTEGRAGMFKDLMGAKFGPLPKWAADRIAKSSQADLDRWGKRMLSAGAIEEVLGKPRS